MWKARKGNINRGQYKDEIRQMFSQHLILLNLVALM